MRWAYYVKEVVSIRFYTSAMKKNSVIISNLHSVANFQMGLVISFQVKVNFQFIRNKDAGINMVPKSLHCQLSANKPSSVTSPTQIMVLLIIVILTGTPNANTQFF